MGEKKKSHKKQKKSKALESVSVTNVDDTQIAPSVATASAKLIEGIEVPQRVDAFTFKVFEQTVSEAIADGSSRLCLNLIRTEFLSMTCMQYLETTAKSLKAQGRTLVLNGVSEKIKRQISIYASLDNMEVQEVHSARVHQVTEGWPSAATPG